MKTQLDCYSCLVRQALAAARFAGADENLQRKVLQRVMQELIQLDPESTPPMTSDAIHRVIREVTKNPDPYKPMKEQSTREALALYPKLKEIVRHAADPFETAVKLSIAGNIIDLAVSEEYNLLGSVERVLEKPLTQNDLPQLKAAIERAPWVLYLADNAGETVFDRLLIEELAPKRVIYVVKSGPALNDATLADAQAAGLDQVAELRTTGYNGIGIFFDKSSPEFVKLFDESQVIIAKGMANYETLSDSCDRVFFLLQVKCDTIGLDIGKPTGDLVVAQAKPSLAPQG
ncbi:MAG: DUF89 family protein [Chloroflexi bacterium]|nr:DUF89 family protein [Chloroflexota bacterium]